MESMSRMVTTAVVITTYVHGATQVTHRVTSGDKLRVDEATVTFGALKLRHLSKDASGKVSSGPLQDPRTTGTHLISRSSPMNLSVYEKNYTFRDSKFDKHITLKAGDTIAIHDTDIALQIQIKGKRDKLTGRQSGYRFIDDLVRIRCTGSKNKDYYVQSEALGALIGHGLTYTFKNDYVPNRDYCVGVKEIFPSDCGVPTPEELSKSAMSVTAGTAEAYNVTDAVQEVVTESKDTMVLQWNKKIFERIISDYNIPEDVDHNELIQDFCSNMVDHIFTKVEWSGRVQRMLEQYKRERFRNHERDPKIMSPAAFKSTIRKIRHEWWVQADFDAYLAKTYRKSASGVSRLAEKSTTSRTQSSIIQQSAQKYLAQMQLWDGKNYFQKLVQDIFHLDWDGACQGKYWVSKFFKERRVPLLKHIANLKDASRWVASVDSSGRYDSASDDQSLGTKSDRTIKNYRHKMGNKFKRVHWKVMLRFCKFMEDSGFLITPPMKLPDTIQEVTK